MSDRINSVAVVGGGIVGWSAAVALKRHLPYLSVTLIDAASSEEDPTNHLASTLPSIVGFHADVGLSDADAIVRAGSSIRLGTRFEGWAPGGAPYLHVYGDYGKAVEGAAFHQLWLAAGDIGGAFEDYSLSAAMGLQNRFANAAQRPLSEVQYGLQIDPTSYAGMMQAYAAHLGVQRSPSPFTALRLHSDTGFIAAAVLAGGAEVHADLYVDCSGPRALLRGALDDDVDDWREWLSCDRLMVAEGPAPSDLPLLDSVAALASGWRWQASSPRRTSAGLCYSSQYGEAAAGADGWTAQKSFHLHQGCRPEPWLRNCVAMGAAALQVEPLDWTNLHLVHAAADRIVNAMPGRSCAPVELQEYNRQFLAEAERIRDFLYLRYATAGRSEPFWEDLKRKELPASLAHTLSLFQERGRLPFYEEETFSRDSWVALLFAHRIWPRRADPLADRVSPYLAAQTLSRMRQMIATAVPQLPSHEQFLSSLHRQVAR